MKDDHQFFTPVARITPCVMQPDRKGAYVAKSDYMELVQHNLELARLASQRGARMQIMREWLASQAFVIPRKDWMDYWDQFVAYCPEAAGWFDADGVPVREEE